MIDLLLRFYSLWYITRVIAAVTISLTPVSICRIRTSNCTILSSVSWHTFYIKIFFKKSRKTLVLVAPTQRYSLSVLFVQATDFFKILLVLWKHTFTCVSDVYPIITNTTDYGGAAAKLNKIGQLQHFLQI